MAENKAGEVAKQGDQAAGGTVAKRDPRVMQQFAQMLTIIPHEDESGADNILTQILQAETWEDLDAPWSSSKADHLAGRVLRLNRAMRRPSDFREGTGFFLVLNLTDANSGADVVVVTSSESVMAQVVQAYIKGWMPLLVEFVVAKRATQNGYHPHHLKIHACGAGAPAQAGA